jgi:hypothetical protein
MQTGPNWPGRRTLPYIAPAPAWAIAGRQAIGGRLPLTDGGCFLVVHGGQHLAQALPPLHLHTSWQLPSAFTLLSAC